MTETAVPEFEQEAIEILNQVSGVTNPQQWLLDIAGNPSATGVSVSTSTALGLPAVWNSVSRIAGDIGKLPVEIRRPTGDEYKTSKLIPRHPAAVVLNGPNERQTGQIFRETLMVNALIEGNGKAYIERNALGQPVELLLLPPAYTYTMMWEGEKWHILNLPQHYTGMLGSDYTEGNGGPPNGWYRIPDSEIFHIPGLSYDGLWGTDVLRNSRDTFGLDAAGQLSAAADFRNSGRPGLLLEAPRNAFSTAKAAKEWVDQFNDMHKGLDNTGRVGLIRDGMKAHTLSTSDVASTHLESRNFSREDVALLFGTEAVMGEGSAVYKDRQDRTLAYLQGCLSRWMARWNHEASRKLFSDRDRAAGVFLEFDTSAMISSDPNTLADYTGKLRQQGIVSVNEVRAMHKLNPVPGGDEVIAPEPEPTESPEVDQPSDEPEQKATAGEGVQSKIAKLAVNRVFRDLIATERKQVKAAAKHDDYWSRWEKIYYHLKERMTNACNELGIDPILAEDYCRDSQDALCELAGVSGPNLADNVSAAVEDWKDNAKRFSDEV